MRNKRWLFISLITFSVVILGCQQDDNENGNETDEVLEDVIALSVLHSFTGEQPQAPVIEPAFEDFDMEHDDVQLSIETAGGNDIEQVLRVQMSAEDPPDVFTHWGMRRTEDYIRNGNIPDITELIESESDMKEMFREGSFDPVTYQGGIYGLPILSYTYSFVVNTELFEEHGVEVPTTYDELRDAVITFEENGLVPFAANNHSARYMLLNFFSQKKSPEDMIAHATAEEPFTNDMLSAAEKVQELASLGAFPDGYMSLATAQSAEIFNAEQAPMFYQQDWTLAHLDSEQMDKYEIIPFPLGDDDSVRTNLSGTGQFIFMSNDAYEDPERREKAWELMKWMASPEIGTRIIEEVADISALEVDYDQSEISPLLAAALEDLETTNNVIPSYDEELFASAVEGDYWPLTDSLLLGNITPEEYVDEMNALIEEHPNTQFDE
ncbi:ABC transporter substrate-binding protein [Amphibacillus cookii]|uniref:ABC transporter substrate-binding protein n=1 Tax=Amphibacillus cookii TaxID=767787 RepID=UPI001957A3FC|nr:extracellular solute-binding protein [Amphibacillus cookii]MBM7540301.1 ABC-type glycerol-3-phosphate transport system substrate-binding protein [Amphibacillus cookii]